MIPDEPASAPDALAAVEIWGRSDIPLGDPALLLDGRLVVSHHPAYETDRRVSVFAGPDRLEPYPDAAWNAGGGGPHALDSVQGLRTDRNGVLWMTDLGARGGGPPKIVGWDAGAGRLHRIIPLPAPVTHAHSEVQDLVIDEARGRLYAADEGAGRGGDGSRAALIVVDLATGRVRRALEGSAVTRPEDVDIVVDGRVVQAFDKASGVSRNLRVGVDGLAIDDRREWLYFGPLNGRRLYRVRCDDLADEALSDAQLEARVQDYARRPNAGGLWIDAADTLYLTAIEDRAIGMIPASDRRYRPIARHDAMDWPDGMIGAPDGWVYVTSSQLPRSPAFNGGRMTAPTPHLVFRFRPPPS